MSKDESLVKCGWCIGNDLYEQYHDKEWGLPLHDDIKIFELLSLEGAQAGLSWLTVLKRRSGYQKAFDGFDPKKVSKFSNKKIAELNKDTGIIRNKLKIASVVGNAKAVTRVQHDYGSLDNYLWNFVDFKPIQHKFTEVSELPSTNDIAALISKELRKKGFNFVGPTICYAFMQASGMVNDHIISCYRYQQVQGH